MHITCYKILFFFKDLKQVLNEDLDGKQVINYYALNQQLDDRHRKKLVKVIIDNLLRVSDSYKAETFMKLRGIIKELFPNEDEVN